MSFSLITLVTLLGWVGAVAALLAYGMVTKGRWTAGSRAFQVTNVTAAALMLLVAAANEVWPSVAANAAWIVIGVHALATFRARAQGPHTDGPADRPVASAPTEPVRLTPPHAAPSGAARLDLAA